MNLAQMLSATVTPLSEYQPTCRPFKPRSGNPDPDHDKANAAKMKTARERYSTAVGNEWSSTATVAARMGTTPPSVQKMLAKLHSEGLMERRNRDNKPYYVRQHGYEWRVKNERQHDAQGSASVLGDGTGKEPVEAA
jgi:predicted Rossmann fold nucleotide-binding protein DprA/Smf involved in DNA uptake